MEPFEQLPANQTESERSFFSQSTFSIKKTTKSINKNYCLFISLLNLRYSLQVNNPRATKAMSGKTQLCLTGLQLLVVKSSYKDILSYEYLNAVSSQILILVLVFVHSSLENLFKIAFCYRVNQLQGTSRSRTWKMLLNYQLILKRLSSAGSRTIIHHSGVMQILYAALFGVPNFPRCTVDAICLSTWC